METAIWIIIAVLAAILGYVAASMLSRRNARSQANAITADARREADVIKEKTLLQAKEEEMRILSEAEKTASQKLQKAQSAENRNKQRERELNHVQQDNQRRKKELDTLQTNLENREQLLDSRAEELDHLTRQTQEELQRISGLSAEEAREKLVESLKDEAKSVGGRIYQRHHGRCQDDGQQGGQTHCDPKHPAHGH